MTAKPLKKNATYDDLVRVPEHCVAEMFDGELYALPRPALPWASEYHGNSRVRAPPFDAIELELLALWS